MQMHPTKRTEIKTNFTKDLPGTFIDDKGQSVTYTLEMYSGLMRYRIKGFENLLPIKGYGLNIITTVQGSSDQSSYDFGFLTSEAYQLSGLIYSLRRSDIRDFAHLRKAIHLASAEWGEPVHDVEGDLVFVGARLKRDPFIKSARKVLKGFIARTQKRIADASKAVKDSQNGKGVGL